MKYEDDGFDPTPYDRILAGIHTPAVMPLEDPPAEPEPEAKRAFAEFEEIEIEETRTEEQAYPEREEQMQAEAEEEVNFEVGDPLEVAADESADFVIGQPLQFAADGSVNFAAGESIQTAAQESADFAGEEPMQVAAEDPAEPAIKEPMQVGAEEEVNFEVGDPLDIAADESVSFVGEEPLQTAAQESVNPAAEEPVQVAAQEPAEPAIKEPVQVEAEPQGYPETEEQEISEIEELFEPIPEEAEMVYTTPIRAEVSAAEQAQAPAEGESKPIKRDMGKVIPVGASAMSESLKFADISEREAVRVYIEEDILVPDVKPDLLSILSMNGQVALQREDLLKISGEVLLNTLYLPVSAKTEPISAVVSKVPFRTDIGGDVSPMETLTIKPEIESIEYKVINERKFRAKMTVLLNIKEYADVEADCFSGIKGEEVQLLKEAVTVTEILAKKRESTEINEVMPVKEGVPKPLKILKSNISVVPNHKQISSEKAVINASVYCSALYLAESNRVDEDVESEERQEIPVFFQAKTEFTQFIPLDGMERQSGSKLAFDSRDLKFEISQGGDDLAAESGFKLSGNVETVVEIYGNSDKEIVTDIYHAHKEMISDNYNFEVKSLAGSGVTEISAREVFNTPEKYAEIEKILYVDTKIKESSIVSEQNKATVSGVIEAELLCLAADEKGSIFSFKKEIPFRGSIDIPGAKSAMLTDYDIDFRDVWFDKISGRQVELNTSVFVSSLLWKQNFCNLIKNPSFVERDEELGSGPSMIVYVTGEDDTLWKIAKRFRTSVDNIAEVNGFEKNRPIKPGSKVLIVK